MLKFSGKMLLGISLFVSGQSFANFEKKGLPDEKNFPSLLSNSANSPAMKRVADSIYDLISLGEYGLEKEVFFTAYKGFQYLQNKGLLIKTNLLTICDYSQSSNNKRLYVIDVLNSRLLFNTYVSHGKNSGGEFANSFSNANNSNKSSLGFMVTSTPYHGKAGLSLRLDGMERGINDHVKNRAIVLHGSRFVNENIMNTRGSIGRSLGCPAVPYGIHLRIIEAIKGGSCFYVNHSDPAYTQNSAIINANFDITPSVELQNAGLQNDGGLSQEDLSAVK